VAEPELVAGTVRGELLGSPRPRGAELVAGAVRPARLRDFAPALPSWAGRIDAPAGSPDS
jgi:hypothetical protein